MERIKKLIRVVLSYPSRLFNRISFRATVVDCEIDKTSVVEHHANVRYSKLGRYTYVSARSSVIFAEVGSFCSIAAGVGIGGGAHKTDAASTSPVFNKGRNIFKKNLGKIEFSPYKNTVIGNDVWIGNRSLVLQGVNVGDGAIVGAGSVVTKDVEPYTIVAGNPAKVIRKRFDDETIEKLLEAKWWDLSDEELIKFGDSFETPEKLLERLDIK